MRRRARINRPASTKRWLDAELGSLRRSPFRPSSWLAFTVSSWRRSLEQWRLHPRAARQLLAGHLVLFTLTRRPWTAVSFVLCATHLGLLGNSDRLTMADLATLLRANLPALLPASRWCAPAAAVTDLLDGYLARRYKTESAFGAYFDLLADLGFWSWFAIRREPHPVLKTLGLGFWAVPAAAITAAYFVSGRAVDYPRLKLVRQISGATQGLLAVRGFALGGHDLGVAARPGEAARNTGSLAAN